MQPSTRCRVFARALLLLLSGLGVLVSPDSRAAFADPAYRAALLELGQRDQTFRTGLQSCIAGPTENARACWQRMRDSDAENMARLHALLWQHGWPLASRVGEDAAFNAFLVIQHAHPGIQASALPAVSVAVLQGELRPTALALLTDRVRVRAGLPQLYGTQSFRMSQWSVWLRAPVHAPEQLNERRRALGLPPLR